MSPLPTGTLTLLFSDIEGSTTLLRRLGAGWGEALSAHRKIMRETFAECAGHELGTEGDSFFVVFTSAQDAVQAAVTAQRRLLAHQWPQDPGIKVRIGLHTGEPERHEDGYIGIDVHRAARIAATAAGGQTVMSATTQALLGGLDDITTRDLGWHRLKDLPEQEHLFEIVAPGTPAEHPPLRSLGTPANLPIPATELVGRAAELSELVGYVGGGARLVTLTGPGGTGKTRLALAVAGEMSGRTDRDLYFARLTAASGANVMWSGIGEAVGALGGSDELPDQRVLRFLRDRSALLVLDNLEQIPDADEVVSAILTAAPAVNILATSRRPLHLAEELLYPVRPLNVPELVPGAPPASLQRGAVELFVSRARMVKRGFTLTEANISDVVELCRRLDGLPLAVELTAARIRLLNPAALLRRLDDLMSEGGDVRQGKDRQLRATIAWSYDLLPEHSRRMFRHLGAFANRFDLAAVTAITATDDPLDGIEHLVDASLVEVVDGHDGEPMFSMLDTIRRFARRQMQEHQEWDDVRLRHARWCLDVATEIAGLLQGPRQMSALDRMDVSDMDIRAALDWCLTPGAAASGERREIGFKLLGPMNTYWYRFGFTAEGRGWHDRAVALLDAADIEDSAPIVDALHGQGVLAAQQNDLSTADDALERALGMANRLNDTFREARESNSLGVARREAGDPRAARQLFQRSLELARRIPDRYREATALSNMVLIHLDLGAYERAVSAAHEAIAADRALDDPWGVAIDQSNLVMALLYAKGPEHAYEHLRTVAKDAVALGDIELSIDVIDSCAVVLAALGDVERSARLLAAADRQRETAGIPRGLADQRHVERFLGPARHSIESPTWRRWYEAGVSLTVDEAIREGLEREAVAPQA